ncbi:helicase-like transcription factor CHR28 [Macadamia integrifolia]|uniref:helicase-like transcription factor CHR28 n=1 Tax=Macadamia integrifolia TaxID=60698 RepID=UPI001C528814|nr:helicase-like transcription factor CHR28 [Macadamia integrifolia]
MLTSNSNWFEDFLPVGDEFADDNNSDSFAIEIDKLFAILGESSDPQLDLSQNSSEDLSCNNVFQGVSDSVVVEHEPAFRPENGNQEYEGDPPTGCQVPGSSKGYPSSSSGPSDAKMGMESELLFESPSNSCIAFDHGNLETPLQIGSPVHSCSLSLADWLQLPFSECDTYSGERVGGSVNAPVHSSINNKEIANQLPYCTTGFNFSVGDHDHIPDCMNHVNLAHLKTEFGNECRHEGGYFHSNGTSHLMMVDKSDLNFSKFSSMCGSSTVDFGELERNLCTSPVEISFMDDIFLPNELLTELNSNQVSDKISEASYHYSPTPVCTDSSTSVKNIAALTDTSMQCIPDSLNVPFMSSNGENTSSIKNEAEEHRLQTQNIWLSSEVHLGTQEGTTKFSASTVPLMDLADANSCQFKCEASTYSSLVVGNPSSNANDGAFLENSSSKSLPHIQSFMSSKKEEVHVKDEKDDQLQVSKSMGCSAEGIDVAAGYASSIGTDSAAKIDVGTIVGLTSRKFVVSDFQSLPSNKNHTVCIKEERNDKALSSGVSSCHSLKHTNEAIHNNPSRHRMHVDADDADIFILEDISAPVCPRPSSVHGKSLVTSQRSTYNDSLHYSGTGSMRLKENDERLTFRVALQDLAQPKSEASPPDGVLAVPLLRHQKIALSWMAQKETASLHCSGGILADDQGLGKTISTIALILKERSPASKMSSVPIKQGDSEALNLDEDDNGSPQLDGMKQDGEPGCGTSKMTINSDNSCFPVKGRPSAGTLVVCPTSVLRQWAEELHNKVTSKANLSVLVYHGTNRTKDPYELAKYDVVLTTYSIVSMEVPKQSPMDKDDDEKGKNELHGIPHMGLSGRKRKYPPSSDKKGLKYKKGTDGELLESVSRPLARVGWFRVILDEAQSIKNHRTRVARACWGLRAKRRWCLSGTPIQNAVDDLYSYFRFLRYDPYAVYKSFCSMIKVPVTKHPTTGYKKLQAVLKTIMLRRTKGTLIDGQPIINLPPKSIELKKVDFSKEEREFYSRLEADSRAQFKVYAAAGTVRQNYVNILFMLLRLRQACDHPLLVKGYDSNSVWRSSREMAKKLPRDKQMNLLKCLEACLAICGICNDPPEDAVVTICGHVFCSQCICEHLTGDDNLCPAADCKVQLSVTSVFSRATLKSSQSEQLGQECSPENSGSELVEKLEPFSEGLPSDSSKIKAALEVLQSLSKPQNCPAKDDLLKSSEVASYPENGHVSHSGGSFEDTPGRRNINVEKGRNDSNMKVAEKAIVFSQWTRMLDLLEARLKSSSIQYRRLDGTMSIVARDKAVKDFNTHPEVCVMIMSLKAASLGLNMVAACHVLLLDLWWNPTTEDQAIDRAHRIGQTRPVTVLRLTVKDTVEDRILALQQKKREMVASAFGEDETGSRQTRLTVEDLKYLFMV